MERGHSSRARLGSFRSAYWHAEHERAREDVKNKSAAIYDMINRQRLTGSAAAFSRYGRPSVLTDADETVLAELSEELDGEYTWEEMTERFNEKTSKT